MADGRLTGRIAGPIIDRAAKAATLREWAEAQTKDHGLADRDDAPSHSPRAWAQVSVPVRECLGAA